MARRERWQVYAAGEARAAPELAAFVALAAPLVAVAPRGDGHPVLVLPGLGGGDASTAPLRWFLRRLGYETSGWGLGTNTGPTRYVSSALDELIRTVNETHGKRVSLVGWSLGGLFATALTRRAPHLVRSVITLGSPLRGAPSTPIGIPTSSVYSRTDAIVPWRASLLDSGPKRENIEVRGSHIGLGHNPSVLAVVADRLAQDERSWQPFVAPRWAQPWLPRPVAAAG